MAQRPEAMGKAVKSASWQEDAWRFYDEVGELRFGIGWLANGMSRVNLVAARQPEHQGDEPSAIEMPDPDDPDAEPLTADELAAVDLVSAIAGGSAGQGQLLAASCIQLSVPGVGFVLMEAQPPDETPPAMIELTPLGDPVVPTPDETWTWRVLATDELRSQGEVFEVATGQGTWRPLQPDHVLVKVWRPHPRKSWEPDSPCRAVLGVLRQIVLLDEHVAATATSRLSGAGVFILPTEAEFVPLPTNTLVIEGAPPVDDDDFIDTFVETMTLPIGDRGTAAAVVPLVVKIPGELCDKPQHITFWSEFNAELLPLRESAVKRLALGLDLPPEQLMGVGGMNHWGAWQIAEEAVTLHVEPMAETVCHALTIGYYRAALAAAGVADPEEFLVWYDTTDLTTRPDRSADAMALYDRVELSAAAARREAGLSEDDAPDDDERRMRILLKVAEGAPTLAPQMLAAVGLLEPVVAEAAAEATEGQTGSPAAGDDEERGPPERPEGDGAPAPVPEGASAALVEACDGLVYRALERAGTKLRSAAGKRINGGAAAVVCPDPALLHTQVKATDYATLDALLVGAWTRVGLIAGRYGCDVDGLTAALDTYTRALIATGHAHDSDRLADALGLYAAV
jgi:hypothetical protein